MQWLKAHVKIKNDDWEKQLFSHTIFFYCRSVCECDIQREKKIALKPTLLTLITLCHIHFRLVSVYCSIFRTMPRNVMVLSLQSAAASFLSVLCWSFLLFFLASNFTNTLFLSRCLHSASVCFLFFIKCQITIFSFSSFGRLFLLECTIITP